MTARRASAALLALLGGCTPGQAGHAGPVPTQEELLPAAGHPFDGRYAGPGRVEAGYVCSSAPPQWAAMLTVDGSRFELTPFIYEGGGRKYRGNVSPGGVLTRSGTVVGRIADGRFQGSLGIGQTCRHSYDLVRQDPA